MVDSMEVKIHTPDLDPVLVPDKQRHVGTLVVLPCVKEPVHRRQ